MHHTNEMEWPKTVRKNIAVLIQMFSLIMKSGKKDCIFVTVVCALSAFMYPITLELSYRIVELIELGCELVSVLQIILIIIVYVCSSSIFQLTKCSNILLFEKMQLKIGTSLMERMFRQVSNLPHAYYDNPDNIAKLKRMTLFSQDSMLGQNVVHTISAFCNALSIMLLFPVLYRAGVEVFLLIVLVSVLGNVFNFNEGHLRWENEQKLEKNNIKKQKVRECFFKKESLFEMRMLDSYDFFEDAYSKLEKIIFNSRITLEKKITKQKLVGDIIQIILKSLPIIYVLLKLNNGDVFVSTFFLIWQTQNQLDDVVSSVFFEIKSVYYSIEYIEELCDFLGKTSKIEPDDKDKDVFYPVVTIKNAGFTYDGTKYILKNINLAVNSGEKIVIIGKNGTGKTTLMKILSGLYDISYGNIYRKYDSSELGVVWQDYVNFELTLRESIGLGCVSEISNETLLNQTIEHMDLEDLGIKLDDTIGCSFDSDGLVPSGGQWQKIAIARAVYGNKKLLIMDEPTASLDPLSEVELYEFIKDRFKNYTVIFISHRIGFASLADRIIVLDKGCIVEDGDYNKLISEHGEFYNFYQEQIKWYEGGSKNE